MSDANEAQQIGVALIGAGMIARTQVAALSAARDRLRLHAIVSRNPDRAKYLAQHYAGFRPRFTSDLAEVANNPAVQMVIVATPPSVRIELIETLAKAGKHILLEKPVARTMEEALQVVEICEAAGVLLGVVFQHRTRAPAKAAARRMASGELGRLGHVEIAAPLWRDQSYYDELGRGTYARDGGGVLLTQAIHTIDLALSLTGPVTTVQAMTATTPLHQMEAEDFAVAGLRFANGAVGSLVASTASFPQGKEIITLHCQHGTLRLSADGMDLFWRDGRVEHEVVGTEDAGESGPIVENHAGHQAVIEDLADAIQEARPPLVSGREALAAQQLIAAIEASSRTGRPVDILS
ncbi:Gfo/Idh/MocA family protein [Paracoccus tegillarcae]|uniref:Oxidoreductase n=1 Tax=Paracoccus tegillarcae TaxID=1529068 RepID=A0A2K9EWW9_9RHOB|nr:Gfo/Idh/MocA family oxidoreductase [Paracoccus tegillarcae]AUH32552.1 oxidoreductase [Paracoccus tegillarcae]